MSARNLQQIEAVQASFWAQFDRMCEQHRIAQSLLVIIPSALRLQPVLDRILTSVVCQQAQAPCGKCSFCLKILHDTHPDVQYIQPEVLEGQIKIEQIRALQQSVYHTPQLGTKSIVVINLVDNLNNAAASALLKILEEPPLSTMFILLSKQPSLLLPTIRSRCQHYRIPEDTEQYDPLSLGQAYTESSVRATIYEQRIELLSDLNLMLDADITPCDLAARWSSFPLSDLLWFLYALIAKLIDFCLVVDTLLQPEYAELKIFSKKWSPVCLFEQLDTIQELMHSVQRRISLNSILALERILIGLTHAH